MSSTEINTLLEKKWRKYALSCVLLTVIGLAVIFVPLALTETTIYSKGVWTYETKVIITKLVLFITVNITYLAFILNKFRKYETRILREINVKVFQANQKDGHNK